MVDSHHLVHKHLIVSCLVENSLDDGEEAKKWLLELVEKIGMKILIPPVVKFCEEEGNVGTTALLAITTSSCTMHIWNEFFPAEMQLDIYSCKEFNIYDVFSHLKLLGSSKIKYKFLDRTTDLIDIFE